MRIDSKRLLDDLIGRVADWLWRYRLPSGRVILTVGDSTVSFDPDTMEIEMAHTFTAGESKQATLSFVDQFGNPARVDGVPVWTLDDPTSAFTLTPDATGLAAVVTSTGVLGFAQLRIEADADLGAGVRSLITLADLEAVAGEAVAGNVAFGPVPAPIP